MTAPGGDVVTARVLEREGAANEVRHWVRLTRRCNNRCLFCHDMGRHDGTSVPVAELQADLRAGRARGATRLVLSGGEPTIHPRFLEVVALGRAEGYRWIQVVSNGRMFAYDRFTADAARAGLDEATLSIHGHTPELHDRLAGAAGAFAQALRGLQNLQRAGRVVSVDVVVCRPNVEHLVDILRFLMRLGVREFDLLSLVPFGRAFEEQREALEFDALEARPHVLSALALAAEPGVHLWTNRWPAPLLEGAEQLIQDPHKLLDDLRGMQPELRTIVDSGEPPHCHGDRCRRCFADGFCRALMAASARLAAGGFPVVAADATALAGLAPAARAALEANRDARLRLRAEDGAAAGAALAAAPLRDGAELELDLARLDGLPDALARRARRVVVRREEDLAVALGLPGVDLELPLGRATGAVVRRALDAALERVVLRAPGRALLSESVSDDLPPAEIAALAATGVRVEGVPRCLAPGARPLPALLDAGDLDGRGGLDLFAFAERWVRDGCRARSLRCAGCAEAARCEGAHLNTVRALGFGWMQPAQVRAGG